MAERLFVYGTLHPDRAPDEIVDVARAMKSLGKGVIRGTLYDLGEYPGVKIGSRAKGIVAGEVFLLPDDPLVFARLDAYEGFDPESPGDSLFRRRRVAVTMSGRVEVCWVYIYNRAVRRDRFVRGSVG